MPHELRCNPLALVFAVQPFISLRYHPNAKTFFRSPASLPPGHAVVFPVYSVFVGSAMQPVSCERCHGVFPCLSALIDPFDRQIVVRVTIICALLSVGLCGAPCFTITAPDELAVIATMAGGFVPDCNAAGTDCEEFSDGMTTYCYLTVSGKDLRIENTLLLSSVSFLHLTQTTGLDINNLGELTTINFPELVTISGIAGSKFNIVDNVKLVAIEFPKLSTVSLNGIAVDISGNTVLTSISFPALTTITASSFAIRLTAAGIPSYCVAFQALEDVDGKVEIDATSVVFPCIPPMFSEPPDISSPAVGCMPVCCGTINCDSGNCVAGLCDGPTE